MFDMKKNYLAPNTEVIDIEFEDALLAGTTPTGFNDGDGAPIGGVITDEE